MSDSDSEHETLQPKAKRQKRFRFKKFAERVADVRNRRLQIQPMACMQLTVGPRNEGSGSLGLLFRHNSAHACSHKHSARGSLAGNSTGTVQQQSVSG